MPVVPRSAAGSKAPAPRPRVGTTNLKSPRLLACTVLLAFAALLAPQAAGASSGQLSLIQDDAELLGFRSDTPAVGMREIRDLGVDIVRTNVIFNKVYKTPNDSSKPRDFRTSDPNNRHYDWGRTDHLIDLAQANNLQVMLTITGPPPRFGSTNPRKCRRNRSCTYKPKASEFGGFAAAAAKRYRGKIAYYSIYNEPNLGKTWLTPRFERKRYGTVDVAGAYYRKLFIAGQKSIARYDRSRRNRVLFGETAAISKPLPMLYAALCLDSRGRGFRGALKRAQGCSRTGRLNIGGFAIHPYNQGGNGTPQQFSRTKTSLPTAHLPRLHRLMDRAARARRIGRGKGIYITEFGYQSNPPDGNSNVNLEEQARYINESDRLHFGDRRVKSVAQYELVDVRQRREFNSGLRFADRFKKPSWFAYRVPIVVTRRSSNSVEVYGQVRPGRALQNSNSGITRVDILMQQGGGFVKVADKITNSRGIFRLNLNRSAGARYQLRWTNPDNVSQVFTSRVARAGRALRYFRN